MATVLATVFASSRNRALAVFAAVSVTALALVPVLGSQAGAASGAPPVPPPGCVDTSPGTGPIVFSCASEGGLLRLHLDGSNYFQYEPDTDADGTIDTEEVPSGPGSPVRQTISTQGCAATLDSVNQLVTLEAGPAGGIVGLRRGSLGVRHQEGGGEPCARTDAPDQTLTLSLGSAPEVAGKLLDWAEIDFERKFDGVVRASFYEGGTAGSLTGTLLLGCDASLSDCGPDSADGDNFRLDTKSPPDGQAAPAPFDTIVLSNDVTGPSNGAFSLEGGDDGTAPGPVGSTLSIDPNDSLFHLVTLETITYQGTLDCGDDDAVSVPSSISATDSTVERLDNKDGSACVLVPYNLTASYDPGPDEQAVDFDVDLSQQANAEFFWVTTWDLETAQYPITKVTEIDFGNGRAALQWCGGTYDPSGATTADEVAGLVPIPGVGGCLAFQDVVVINGQIQVIEGVLLSEDPFKFR